MSKVKAFAQLTKEERAQIEVLLHQGLSYTRIASLVNRSVSTISREVRRNQSGRRGNRPACYFAYLADRKAQLRHSSKFKRRYFDDSMKSLIVHWLTTERLSPELITVKERERNENFVSHEWIYQWIWKMKKSNYQEHASYKKLYRYLRYARRRRRRGRKRNMRGNILQRKWIDQRPMQADKRLEPGHMEADIMLGKDRQPGNLIVLDRKSRKCWLRKLKNKDAAYVTTLLEEICVQAHCKTLTLDNDQSFAMHYKLHGLGIETFFTHPYSSQEKGSVENRIGIIRMFFPKKTNFREVTEQQVEVVEKIINERPLRMFKYKSPNEIHIS
jgi:IS30 family transposase